MKRTIVVVAVFALVVMALFGSMQVESQTGNTWNLDYFPNLDWAGQPVYSQTINNPYLNLNWGTSAPGPNLPSANWTARAQSSAYFSGGTYRFTITADDEVVFLIDGIIYLDTRDRGLSGKNLVIDIPMSPGWHQLRIDLRQYTGNAYLYASWGMTKPGGGQPQPPPVTKPLPFPTPPASAPSVQTRYGDFTPCIQNGSHQSNCFQSDGAWNSPNLGSIQMEPQIRIWGNCEPADSDVTWTVDPSSDPVETQGYRCSKTLAGWFPR